MQIKTCTGLSKHCRAQRLGREELLPHFLVLDPRKFYSTLHKAEVAREAIDSTLLVSGQMQSIQQRALNRAARQVNRFKEQRAAITRNVIVFPNPPLDHAAKTGFSQPRASREFSFINLFNSGRPATRGSVEHMVQQSRMRVGFGSYFVYR